MTEFTAIPGMNPGWLFARVGAHCEWRIMNAMATFRISEADVPGHFSELMARVRAGEEIEIKSGPQTVAVIRPATHIRRTAEEILACLPKDSPATIDEDFARDVEAAIAAHREPLNPPAWD